MCSRGATLPTRSSFALAAVAATLELAAAFTGPALPFGLAIRTRAVAPVCLVAPDQMPSVFLNVESEPLTVVDGRGDKRTKKGKIKSKSFGKVHPATQQRVHCICGGSSQRRSCRKRLKQLRGPFTGGIGPAPVTVSGTSLRPFSRGPFEPFFCKQPLQLL